VIVSPWSEAGGEYPLWGTEHSNPMALERFDRSREVTFTTPLKLPAIIQKVIGESEAPSSLAQYWATDEAAGTTTMWCDIQISGVPLADSVRIQYGYTIQEDPVSEQPSCEFTLTACSQCTKKLQLGLDKMIEQLIHDLQKVQHKLWAEALISAAEAVRQGEGPSPSEGLAGEASAEPGADAEPTPRPSAVRVVRFADEIMEEVASPTSPPVPLSPSAGPTAVGLSAASRQIHPPPHSSQPRTGQGCDKMPSV